MARQVFGGKPSEFGNAAFLHRQQRPSGSDSGLLNIEGSMGPLLILSAGTRDFKATDLRDKIFSLLGISDEGVQPVFGSPLGHDQEW